MKTTELRAKRGGLINEMKSIMEKAKSENRGMNAEEEQRWAALDNEAEGLKVQADRQERMENLEAELEQRNDYREHELGEKDPAKKDEAETRAFRDYIMRGINHMDPKNRAILESRKEERAQTVTTTGGGYLIPQGFMNQIEIAMLPYVSMWDFANVMSTPSGADLPWPTVNDTSNKGELLGINTQAASQDVTFGSTTLKAYKFSSKQIPVPIELMQDSGVPIEQLLANLLGQRVGRILNQYFTTGTGSGQPQGVVYGSTACGVTASSSAITRDNIVDLMHSVNADYRKNGTFMMSDAILKLIKKLTIGTGDDRPLWQPGFATGDPDTIEGRPYIINDEMDAIGTSKKIMVFGDMKKFMIRNVMEFSLLRLNEIKADYGQVVFLGFKRADSAIIDAGTHPIKHLPTSAT
jgi:HK97 family phage major capsid protein